MNQTWYTNKNNYKISWIEKSQRPPVILQPHGLAQDHMDKRDERKNVMLCSQRENSTTNKKDTKNQKSTANSKSPQYKLNTTEKQRLKYSPKIQTR